MSYSEIRYELPLLPGSMLEHIEDLLIFPSPPVVLGTNTDCLDDETIAWYYFLADIAARHLINRILDAKQEFTGCPTEGQARSLLGVYELFESQLDDWYQSCLLADGCVTRKTFCLTLQRCLSRIRRGAQDRCAPFGKLCTSSVYLSFVSIRYDSEEVRCTKY